MTAYRVLLTEGGYTTAGEPVSRDAAMADFAEYAPHGGPFSRSFLRVVTDSEYHRIRPELERRNASKLNSAPNATAVPDA